MSLLLEALKGAERQKGEPSGESHSPIQAPPPPVEPARQEPFPALAMELAPLPAPGSSEPETASPESAAPPAAPPDLTPIPSPGGEEAIPPTKPAAVSPAMPKQRERRKAGKYPSPARRRRWLLGGLASAIALATAGTLFWLDQQAPAPSIAVQLPPPAPAGLLASQETSGPEVVVDDARPGGRVADKSAPPAPGPDARKPPPPQPEAEPAPVAARIPATVRRNEQIIITVHPATAAGYAAMADGNLDSAREHYQQALRGDQRNRDALLGLAVAALLEGRSEEAVRRYEQVLALDPRDPDANAGIALQRSAMDPVAYESRLRALLAERGDNAALHHAFGSLLARQNRWGEAQEALFRAVTLAPSSADYQFNLAVSLDHLGQYAQARTYYRKALEQGKAGSIAFSRDAVQARIAAIEALAP